MSEEHAAEIAVLSEPPDAVLRVAGELDMASCPELDRVVAGLCGGQLGVLSVDLGDVTFMGSSGLASLLRAQRLAERAGGRLVLAAASRPVLDLLAMTHLAERFGVDP